MSAYNFSGRTVIITGAGEGIGYALCKTFAESGAFVALNDIDGDKAKMAGAQINAALDAEQVTAYGLDVADVDAVRQMTEEFSGKHGRLDIVIANAGITSFGTFLEYTPAEFDRVTGVNLRGTYFTAQAAAQNMLRLGTTRGRILLTSSVTGQIGYPNLSAYGMTKAGIAHLAKVLAVELGGYGITVNSICPGATVTERTLRNEPDYVEKWQLVAPNQRVGRVDDIAQTALFLASDAAQHITGQTIVVDGGWTITSPIPPS
jgi:NAD(P)-dependent dehydrogenase (short-subunit alcohol dehydrogenase family)